MFQFGLFSTHIPYVITVVAYLLSYGYYAISKPNAEVAEHDTAALISTSYEIGLENAANHQTYDATGHFQVQQAERPEQNNVPLYVGSISQTLFCPHNTSVASHFRVYALFSRPPTFC